MVEATIRTVDPTVPVKLITASRGKMTRAEPIAALYEKGIVHHVDVFRDLEGQMATFVPGEPSPDPREYYPLPIRAASTRPLPASSEGISPGSHRNSGTIAKLPDRRPRGARYFRFKIPGEDIVVTDAGVGGDHVNAAAPIVHASRRLYFSKKQGPCSCPPIWTNELRSEFERGRWAALSDASHFHPGSARIDFQGSPVTARA
jgi:hypothetical protein